MVIKNVVIINGDDNQIEEIKKKCLFRGKNASFWRRTCSRKSWQNKFLTDFEFPLYRLKEISLDYPDVKISYYYYIEKPFIIISSRKLKNGEITK